MSNRSGTRRKWLKRLLAVAMGCTIGCLLAEAALRTAEIGYPQLFAPDEFCGSRLRPATTGVWISEGHGHVSINSRGFRGPELSLGKPPDVCRIAILGDSFIEALQVDADETLCALLEKQFNDEASSDQRRYEVINCGVSGYGTAQELEMLRHHLLPLDPDVVLLAIYPENDIRNNCRSLEGDAARPYFTLGADGELCLDESFRTSVPYVTACSAYERGKAQLVNRCYVLQVLKQAKLNLTHPSPAMPPQTIEETLAESVQAARYVYEEPAAGEPRQAWSVTERLIQEMATTCRAERILLFVFTVSSAVQVYPDHAVRQRVLTRSKLDDFFYAEHRLQALCREAEIRFVPLATKLQEAADDSGDYMHGFANTRLGVGHWSRAGHAAAARILAETVSGALQ